MGFQDVWPTDLVLFFSFSSGHQAFTLTVIFEGYAGWKKISDFLIKKTVASRSRRSWVGQNEGFDKFPDTIHFIFRDGIHFLRTKSLKTEHGQTVEFD